MSAPRIWTAYPGHNQSTNFYGYRKYRGCTVEVWEKDPGVFFWSFYDDSDPDAHALPIARGDDPFSSVNDAAADAEDYIDGWISE